MRAAEFLNVHPLIGDRVRLAIMAALIGAKFPVSFAELLDGLKVTKGNLSTHLKRLEDADLIKVEKRFVDRKPLTTYTLSDGGLAAFKDYVEQIQSVLKMTTT